VSEAADSSWTNGDRAPEIRQLDRIDWSFPGSGTDPRSIHKLHWFAGNFIPQIPAALIELLSVPGDLVLDPFGGSGTTVLEAARLGRRSIYSDSVTACAFIARSKVALGEAPPSRETREHILQALTWRHACHSDEAGVNGEGSASELADWFAPGTLGQLRHLWRLVETAGDASLGLIFSDLLFACASTEGSLTSTGGTRRHHWGWIADNVRPKELVEHDAVQGFVERLAALPQVGQGWAHRPLVLQADARRLPLADGEVDLIVTSPPYISVIDYVRAQRLLYLWMNWPFDVERADEIGARYKRRRQDATIAYLAQMRDCWAELARVLKPRGRLAVVLGESRAFPEISRRTMEDAAALMPLVWGPAPRRGSRRRVSDRMGRESHEILFVAEKP
jgi:hypothetical protein